MKYSLRNLMIVMTAIAMALGYSARANSLILLAKEHDERCQMLQGLSGSCFLITVSDELEASSKWHAAIAAECRQAAWRPWMSVDQKSPPGIMP